MTPSKVKVSIRRVQTARHCYHPSNCSQSCFRTSYSQKVSIEGLVKTATSYFSYILGFGSLQLFIFHIWKISWVASRACGAQNGELSLLCFYWRDHLITGASQSIIFMNIYSKHKCDDRNIGVPQFGISNNLVRCFYGLNFQWDFTNKVDRLHFAHSHLLVRWFSF